MIYLDNAATTFPKPQLVYETMDDWNRNKAVNAGRGGYKLAREASKMISDTKQKIRELVSADITCSVVFSPSVTVAMNQIANGLDIKKTDTVYITPYEHNAVARTINLLAHKVGFSVKMIPLDENTLEIDIEKMKYEFSKDRPNVVFATHVSNVTGYILPVERIFEEAKRFSAITVLDSAQSLGLIEVNVSKINADLIAFAGHKTLYGPFGIGGFINVKNIDLQPFIVGGTGSDSLNLDMPDGMESKYESASSNIVAIAGLNAALSSLNQSETYSIEKELTEYLINSLSTIKGLNIYGIDNSATSVGIVSFTLQDITSEDLGIILDEDFSIAVRTGYHCAPYIHDFLNDKNKLGTVRVGLSQFNSKKDIDKLVQALKEIANE